MTTIAYKDGVIAYDSRIVSGITIWDDDFDKCIFRDGLLFFISGATCDYDKLINHFLKDRESSELKTIKASAIILEKSSSLLFEAHANNDEGFWFARIDSGKICAVGSGTDHALTAMDMGATAREAVEMAAKRDTCTGGNIRAYQVFGEIQNPDSYIKSTDGEIASLAKRRY